MQLEVTHTIQAHAFPLTSAVAFQLCCCSLNCWYRSGTCSVCAAAGWVSLWLALPLKKSWEQPFASASWAIGRGAQPAGQQPWLPSLQQSPWGPSASAQVGSGILFSVKSPLNMFMWGLSVLIHEILKAFYRKYTSWSLRFQIYRLCLLWFGFSHKKHLVRWYEDCLYQLKTMLLLCKD